MTLPPGQQLPVGRLYYVVAFWTLAAPQEVGTRWSLVSSRGSAAAQTSTTVGKGECITPPELNQIEEKLRKGELDLLIMEDLGRLVRGGEATRFRGVAVDHGTTAIAINDYLDTADPTWSKTRCKRAANTSVTMHTPRDG